MQDTTTTTTTAATITAAPLVEAGKKQYTVGSSYEQKLAIAELCLEFERPGSNKKTVKMSEKEAIECLFQVATDRRFVTVPVMESIDIDGESFEVQSIDEDGNLIFETKDLIAQAWEGIVERDYPTIKENADPVAALIASFKRYGKAQGLSAEMIQGMIDSAISAAGKTAIVA